MPEQATLTPPAAAATTAARAADGTARTDDGLLARLGALLRAQGHWLLVIVPILVLGWGPFAWCQGTWQTPHSPITYQPFVPLLTLALVWARRGELALVYRELTLLFPSDSPKRRGRLWLAALGCALILFTYAAKVAGLSIVALIVIVIGVVYYVYGREILRYASSPLLFLFTMVPPPITAIAAVRDTMTLAVAARAADLLHSLGVPSAAARDQYVLVPGYRLEVGWALSGLGVLGPTLALTLWLLILKRARPWIGLVLLALATGIVLLLNLLRVALVARLGMTNSGLADSLNEASSWFLVAPAFTLVWGMSRLMGIGKKTRRA